VNTTDRPSEEHLAERRADGKFYYVHPKLRDVKMHWGMKPINPTPVESFGMMVDVKAGILVGARDETAEVTATYSDGRPRRWQGSRMFAFRIQNDEAHRRRKEDSDD
jgi:hypothetical protein